MEFELHKRLEKDLILLKQLELSDLFFLPNAQLPWVVLVPRVPAIKELHQLRMKDQQSLLLEINELSKKLEKEFTPDKINIASLGNMVPQLHIHIICRYKNDPAWPGSIFGTELDSSTNKTKILEAKIKSIL